MTGRSKFGKMSTRVRMIAKTEDSARATTRTRIVIGRRRAARIRPMVAISLSPDLVTEGTAAGRLVRRQPQAPRARLRGERSHRRPRLEPGHLRLQQHRQRLPIQLDSAPAVAVRWAVLQTVPSACSRRFALPQSEWHALVRWPRKRLAAKDRSAHARLEYWRLESSSVHEVQRSRTRKT